MLKALNLNRKTYYDNLKRIAKKDKYAEVKDLIKDIYYNEGQGTYGYRPMWAALRDKGVKLAMETVRKLMRSIGLKTELYHKRTAKYSSYKGTVGKVADNLLQQHFDEERPYHVLHTDITEYALTNGKKVYISPVVDDASLEILACTASYSPDMELVLGMLDELETKLPAYSHPVIHSDQGSQYQSPSYQARLKEMELVQSMSRKGNCHDNAPGETIFNLMKRERLNRVKLHSLEEVGTVGKVADNLLQQHFDEERPYHVLHTDITEYALTNGKKVYISPVVDEASLEILACTASYSPDMELVLGMLDELETKLPAYSHPVIHSDQGSQYQSPSYQARLKEMELVQSMSRKGNCHDNAPGETIFNLMKRERLNRVKLHSLEEVQQELEDYIYWFNNIRRSNKLNYATPVKYRDRVMATI
ncbi:IS3 family transposase [Lactobacillus delbrueckii subsp. lactis]